MSDIEIKITNVSKYKEYNRLLSFDENNAYPNITKKAFIYIIFKIESTLDINKYNVRNFECNCRKRCLIYAEC